MMLQAEPIARLCAMTSRTPGRAQHPLDMQCGSEPTTRATSRTRSGSRALSVHDNTLSAAERLCYRVPARAVTRRAVVLAKVRFANLLFVTRGEESISALNGVAQKHVDLLLCDRETMRPLVAAHRPDYPWPPGTGARLKR